MATTQSLGELFDPLGEHLQDPYPFYARARADEPVFWSPRVNAWVVTRYTDVRRAQINTGTFSSANAVRPLREPHPATMQALAGSFPPPAVTEITADGADHARLREPFTTGLHRQHVQAAEAWIRRRAQTLAAKLADHAEADLVGQYADPLAFGVIAELIGLPPRQWDAYRHGSHQFALLTGSMLDEPQEAAAARDAAAFLNQVTEWVQHLHARPDGFLASQVLTALLPPDRDRPPTGEQLALGVYEVAGGLLVAGWTTTAALLASALRHLLTDRSRWELLRGRPGLLEDAVEELARFDPPVQAFFRVTTRPTVLGEAELPAGGEVLVCYGSANRDPELCADPDRLDLTRPRTAHLTWAAGPHHCPGAGLARRVVAIGLAALLETRPDLRLVDDQPIRIRPSLAMRGPEQLLASTAAA